MKNYEWLVKNGYKFSEVNYCFSANRKAVDFYIDGELIGKAAGKSYLEAFTEWLDQEHKPILDEVERKYLKAVIKPFRKRIKCIGKGLFADGLFDRRYYLYICFNDGSEDMIFPFFLGRDMYTGMEVNDDGYSLDELGL